MSFDAHAAEPINRTFTDWTLGCDNVRTCVAVGVDEDSGLVVRIERDAGPATSTRTTVFGSFEGARRMFVDGRPVALPPKSWKAGNGAEETWVVQTRQLGATQAFLDAIRNGKVLATQARPGEDDPKLSLQGLSAALLLMDEAQGRLGTKGALVRRGSKAESTVPAAASLPSLQHAPVPRPLKESDARRLAASVRKAQRALLEKEDCTSDDGEFDNAYALTDSDALVMVECMRGAYQGTSVLFRTPRRNAKQAERVVLEGVGAIRAQDMLTMADYNPETATLSHFAKGRGLGDCGEFANWVFDGERFHLADYSVMDHCAGLMPDEWKTLWRTREPLQEKPLQEQPAKEKSE
ncbi:DUF1176 domain-containing protein [Lysobacter fragariae]